MKNNSGLPGFVYIQTSHTSSVQMKDINVGDKIVVKYDPDIPLYEKTTPGIYFNNGIEVSPPQDSYQRLTTGVVTVNVINKFYNGTKKVYAYTDKHNQNVLICTSDHKLLVRDGNNLIQISAETCYKEKFKVMTYTGNALVLENKIDLGNHDIFDLEVEHEDHSYVTNGIRVFGQE